MSEEIRKNLVPYRLERSEKSLHVARIVLEASEYSDSINRIYYACFYAVTALLLTNDITPKSHSGTKTMFHKHFALTNMIAPELTTFYSQIFTLRQEEDYSNFAGVNATTALEMFSKAEKFIQVIKSLINTEFSPTNDQ